MLTANVELYLPITQHSLEHVIAGGVNKLQDNLSNLAVSEIASLLVLQSLTMGIEKNLGVLERKLATLIETGHSQIKAYGAISFISDVISLLELEKISQGYGLLQAFKIQLLDEMAINEKDYLTEDETWDYTFSQRHSQRLKNSVFSINNEILTRQQLRIKNELKVQIDDHIHIQGYAGTGKSFLISDFISMLDQTSAKVLVLTESMRQLNAVKAKIQHCPRIDVKTFHALACDMMPDDLTNTTTYYLKTSKRAVVNTPDNDIIQFFGIFPSESLSANRIVQAIHGTVKKFCYSDDNQIVLNHIPQEFLFSDLETKHIILHYATELWKKTIDPSFRGFKTSLRAYHQIKWVALNGWQIPNYSHILVDECHHLSSAMLQILDNALITQAVISLGDEYQNLQGKSQQRSTLVRCREITESVRSGQDVANIVNPIISADPFRVKALFQGNIINQQNILYYNKAEVPDKPTTILVNDLWELFEWAQRIASKNINCQLLTASNRLTTFVNDCIELYNNQTDAQPRHLALVRFKRWRDLANVYHNNKSFEYIQRMLANGYHYRNWQLTLAKLSETNTYPYSLGMIDDVRNHEFQSVMITPGLIRTPLTLAAESGQKMESTKFSQMSSSVYIAVTRAQHTLILPEALRHWIEDISVGQ